MPTVNLKEDDLINRIGEIDPNQFEELCFQFGLEIDEITSEYEIVSREQGEERAVNCSKDRIYKLDVGANRTDLLCIEGILRALSVYEKKSKAPTYLLKPSKAKIVLNVKSEVDCVRPYVVAAVLRNITLDQSRYESFIALQDKLHQNIGRKRSIVSIGTHDLDTISGPFTYTAQKPSDIRFIPLNETKEYTAEELMLLYSGNSHLKPYLSIIKDSPLYPVIYDANGVVCSFPPIINSEHSKIKLSTKNIFIEITATNLNKASVALDTVVTMFSEYCLNKFEIEPVEVRRSDGSSTQYPELPYRLENVSADYINRSIGLQLQVDEIATLLERMMLKAIVVKDGIITVEIPPTRHDVLHKCDIMEDVSIAYGYDNVMERVPPTNTVGGRQPLNVLTEELRVTMARLGFAEALTFILCSHDDISTKFLLAPSDVPAVQISNPKTAEFQIARTRLLPGLLNTIANNQQVPLPMRLFEVQDVVMLDSIAEVGARNHRHLCAVHYGITPDFEGIYDTVHSVLQQLGVPYKDEVSSHCSTWSYSVSAAVDAAHVDGRSFHVILSNGQQIGTVAMLHPLVVRNFKIRKGYVTYFEIKIDCFE